jgi:hypothetical protein
LRPHAADKQERFEKRARKTRKGAWKGASVLARMTDAAKVKETVYSRTTGTRDSDEESEEGVVQTGEGQGGVRKRRLRDGYQMTEVSGR